jgi:hypothetical protein
LSHASLCGVAGGKLNPFSSRELAMAQRAARTSAVSACTTPPIAYLSSVGTSRRSEGTRGVDPLIYGVSDHIYKGIQVTALSKRSPVPLGRTLDGFIGDRWIIVTSARRCQSGVLRHEAGRSEATCSQRRKRRSRFLLAAAQSVRHRSLPRGLGQDRTGRPCLLN